MFSEALYNAGINAFSVVIKLAGAFNTKAKKRSQGGKVAFKQLEEHDFRSKPTIWIHAASLGEFEQGRPVIEEIRERKPQYQILLTFFSPSGYEVRKDYSKADLVTYIPLDRESSVKRFLDITNPEIVILIKYEFWSNLITELSKRSIPIYSVSSIFRSSQVFFKGYGSFFRSSLERINHFFVQDKQSLNLLSSIKINRVTVVGDTRFDRVIDIAENKSSIEEVENFVKESKVLVIGSSWQEDLEVILPYINETSNNLKFIIAPHEISEKSIKWIRQKLEVKHTLFSNYKEDQSKVLIIDNIGMLSSIYGYGHYAFIGGAYGDGLHNILEAAVYGIPIMFGNKNYKKFAEAIKAIELGGAFTVSDSEEFKLIMNKLMDSAFYRECGSANKNFVYKNKGATQKIMDKIFQSL
ncbi:MAG: glycosyltransferase N-terminal domain-containing protein [Bacteroidota bacterium]